MWPSKGPSFTQDIVRACMAILVACVALRLAAEFLLAALPVLLPAAVVVGSSVLAWRWWQRRYRGW